MPDLSVTKLAIVDDHILLRKGMKTMIGDFRDPCQFLFEAGSFGELQENMDKDNLPAIVLLDIDMPGGDSISSIQWLKEYFPGVKILATGFFNDDAAIRQMLQSGADGALDKAADPDEFKSALRTMMKKGFYYSDFINAKYKTPKR